MQNMSSGKSALGLDANVVAGLCYVGNLVCLLGLILSIVTLITDKTNKLARFHALQSIFLFVIGLILWCINWVFFFVGIALDNALGFPIFSLLFTLVMILLWLALLVGIIFAAVKAFQGQIFKLPVVGKFADQYSN